MPAPNPSSGPTVWIIACILFICLVAGGLCLASYILLPESETSPSLPVIGVILVCLPWVFWTLTFLYRVLSRAFGFRIGVGGANGGGGGGANLTNVSGNAGVGSEGNGLNRTLSVASHESEKPLKSSMAS